MAGSRPARLRMGQQAAHAGVQHRAGTLPRRQNASGPPFDECWRQGHQVAWKHQNSKMKVVSAAMPVRTSGVGQNKVAGLEQALMAILIQHRDTGHLKCDLVDGPVGGSCGGSGTHDHVR